MVLRAHVVDPAAADSLALHGRLARKVVQVTNPGSYLGDACILVLVQDGLLPEALLALRQLQLHQRLDCRFVHVFRRRSHAQLWQHCRFHVAEDAGRLVEVVRCRLESVGRSAIRRQPKLAVEDGKVEQYIEEFVLQVILHQRPLGIVSQCWIPGEVCADLSSSPSSAHKSWMVWL